MARITTKQFARAAGMRAFKTFCQTFVATIGTSAAGLADVSWVGVLSASALAAIVSLAMSCAGLPEVDSDGDGVADLDETEG